ncbi:MAG: hypothetical protein BGO09_12805 [Bacteroidetes bacterium 47-18]|nr:MAG: hypothetical protein BGO09_12805 [Bacteroidetes bacterium 47-18]
MSGMGREFMFYSLFMVEKYKLSDAYFDVYLILQNNQMNNNLQKYYLLKAYANGSESALSHMTEMFGENYDSLQLVNYNKELEQYLFDR